MSSVDESRQDAWRAMQSARSREIPEDAVRLKTKSPGGTSGGVSDDGLKSRVDFLHTAFLGLIALIVTGLLGVIGVSVTMSNNTNGRIDKGTEAVSTLNRQVGEVSVKADESNRRLDRIERKLDEISAKLK